MSEHESEAREQIGFLPDLLTVLEKILLVRKSSDAQVSAMSRILNRIRMLQEPDNVELGDESVSKYLIGAFSRFRGSRPKLSWDPSTLEGWLEVHKLLTSINQEELDEDRQLRIDLLTVESAQRVIYLQSRLQNMAKEFGEFDPAVREALKDVEDALFSFVCTCEDVLAKRISNHLSHRPNGILTEPAEAIDEAEEESE